MDRRLLPPALASLAFAFLAAPAVAQGSCDDFWLEPQGDISAGADIGDATLLLHAPAGCEYAITYTFTRTGPEDHWLDVYPTEIVMETTEVEVSVSWLPNESPSAKSGTITVQGPGDTQFINVHQAASSACRVSVGQSSFYFDRTGGGGTVSVYAGEACPWQPAADDWIRVSGGAGQGNGIVSFSVGAYDGTEARIGHITLGDASVLVSQAGVTAEPSPGAPPLGSSGSGSNHSDDEFSELFEDPGPEPALVMGAVALAAALGSRRKRT